MGKFAQAIEANEVSTQGKGIRITGSTEPELTLAPTLNKFVLNAAAVALMGIKSDGVDEKGNPIYPTITISTSKTAENNNEMFAIHLTPNGKGGKLASTSNEEGTLTNLSFNLAGTWAIMLNGEVGINVLPIHDLRKKGLVIAKTATRKVFYTLVDAGMDFILNSKGNLEVAQEGDADTFRVYELVDRAEQPYEIRETRIKTDKVIAPVIDIEGLDVEPTDVNDETTAPELD